MENDYRQHFETLIYRVIRKYFWFKMYDGDQVGNSVTRYLNTGGGNVGVTASLVDDYLTIDGRPLVGKELLDAKRVYPMNCSRLCETPVCHRLFVCRGSNCNLLGLVIRTL